MCGEELKSNGPVHVHPFQAQPPTRLHVEPTCLPPLGHSRTVPTVPCPWCLRAAPKTYLSPLPSTAPPPLPDLASPRGRRHPQIHPPPAALLPDPALPPQNPAAPRPRRWESGGVGRSSSSHGGRGGEYLAVPDFCPHHDRAAACALHHHAPLSCRLREGQDHPLPLLGVPPLREVPQVDLQKGADAAALLLLFTFLVVTVSFSYCWILYMGICCSDSILLVLFHRYPTSRRAVT